MGSTPTLVTRNTCLAASQNGRFVQWEDACLANRRLGFDSPTIHLNKTEGSRIRVAGSVCYTETLRGIRVRIPCLPLIFENVSALLRTSIGGQGLESRARNGIGSWNNQLTICPVSVTDARQSSKLLDEVRLLDGVLGDCNVIAHGSMVKRMIISGF